jgi:hypothetical protein
LNQALSTGHWALRIGEREYGGDKEREVWKLGRIRTLVSEITLNFES